MKPSTEQPSAPDTLDARLLADNLAKAADLWQRIMHTLSSANLARPAAVGPTDPISFTESILHALRTVNVDPVAFTNSQVSLMHSHMKLWQVMTNKLLGKEAHPMVEASPKDRRFKDKGWQESPVFDYLKQGYLINAQWLQQAVGAIKGLDTHAARKLHFFTRQFIDAMSPSNFALTNPEVMRTTFDSNGENLVRGLENLLKDLEKSSGQLRISMTDESAFVFGKNIAATKGSVVFQNDLMQLIQYAPVTEKVHKTPLLLVPAWINKYYVLDLTPENSLVKYLTEQGYTVFISSWVNPTEELARKTFDHYLIEGPLTALNVIEKITGTKQTSLVGYCLGGTLTAVTLAWLRARGEEGRIASATYLTTLVDFTEAGELAVFIDDAQLAALEDRMSEQGYLDAGDMANTFNMLRANDLIWSFVVNNYLLGKQPFPFDLLYWNADATRMPATMHAFYLRNMYQRNLLSKPNGLTIHGEPMNLSKITVPTYVLATQEDHIAPWKSTYLATQIYDGDTVFTLSHSGHIAGVINPPSKKKYGYFTNKKLPPKAEDWLACASETPGSWWPHWNEWQKRHAGAMVKARAVGNAKYKPIEPAPGSYAKVRG